MKKFCLLTNHSASVERSGYDKKCCGDTSSYRIASKCVRSYLAFNDDPAPKQIPVNAHINLKDDLANAEVIQIIADVEAAMKEAEPKVDMIFLETANLNNTSSKNLNPKHIG